MNNTNTNGSEKTTEKNATLNKISQENIEKYLKGMSFPTEKKHILEQAKKNNAPQAILDDLNKLKEQKYHNQGDITKVVCH
jgi:ABC-type taurine transport system substrate-binding protein